MSDDYEIDYEISCEKCGNEFTHSRRCTEMGCDDGWIDLYEVESDPLWYDPGDFEMCDRCHGTGIERWCPKCGADVRVHYVCEEGNREQ